MKKRKDRIHREWFRTIIAGNRKSCPGCHAKLESGELIWQWGEYVCSKWRNVLKGGFCKTCYHERVEVPMVQHRDECGCNFELVAYGGAKLPEWLKLGESGQCVR